MQRKMIAKLRHDHLRQQTRARRAFLNGLRRLTWRLYRAGARVLFENIFDYDQLRRNVLKPLAGLFAELAQILRTAGTMLFGFLKIVHDTFAFQMAGQSAAAPRTRPGAAAWRGRRGFVIRTVSDVFALRQIFNVYTLSLEFGFE